MNYGNEKRSTKKIPGPSYDSFKGIQAKIHRRCSMPSLTEKWMYNAGFRSGDKIIIVIKVDKLEIYKNMKNKKQIIENSFSQRNFIIIVLTFLIVLPDINTTFAVNRTRKKCRVIFGQVISPQKNPVEEVVVTLEKSEIHTKTNRYGNYIIEIPKRKGQVLIFSSTGYLDRTIVCDTITSPSLNISLQYDLSVEGIHALATKTRKEKQYFIQVLTDFINNWRRTITKIKELHKKELTKGELSDDEYSLLYVFLTVHSSNFDFYIDHYSIFMKPELKHLDIQLQQSLKELNESFPDDL